MSTFTGYKCDVCGQLIDDRDGTMKLEIRTSADVRPSSGFEDICTPVCLAVLAVARLRGWDFEEARASLSGPKAEKPKRTRTVYSDETKELVRIRAREVGIQAAAREFGVPATTALRWKEGNEDTN